ncbi:unnamed protein product [Parnassius apollo]|uniref:(apollo) hypothetical protein n=1 Tax=Parnassius apollo TaxID=110799 RepID=A0A8S3Y4X0_PARAO|nr:unnamed protein product [Parnassius apollo]
MTQNQDLHKSLEMFTNRHEELLQKINILEQENNDYKKRVCVLEHKLNHLERNASTTTIEIRNLFKQSNENKEALTHIIQKLGSTLGLETSIQESEIRNIYRFRSETLVVDFTTSLREESIISKYKIYNKAKREGREPQLNSNHINLPGPSRPIYISEYLTSKVRRLFYLARENVKNRKLVAAWTTHGKVYVKKEEGAAPIRIEEENDLQKFKPR